MKTATKSIDLISKKKQIARAVHFFVHFFAVVLHDYKMNAVLHDKNMKRPSYTLSFIGELSYVFTKTFVACVLVRFYFFHYRSFSTCWPLTFLIFSLPL